MPRPLSGETKTYDIKRPMSNGVTYVYRRTEKYDPVKQRMMKVGKDALLGKILPSSNGEIVPTRPRRKISHSDPQKTKGSETSRPS